MKVRKKREKSYSKKELIEIIKRIETLVSTNEYTIKEISSGLNELIEFIEKKD